ncbi:MAG: hypothetical protein MUC81_11845 [Bacteroidia bacterium]|nr:hypothetical protein [Bacteroidia bacterium]
MKTNMTKIAGALLFFAASTIIIVGCKSKKPTPIEKQTGAVEISIPFSGSEFQTNKEYFRARSSGNSIDMVTAKKIALQNAKSEMAGMIQTTMKKVTEQYTNQRQIGNQQEFNNKFEELAREVTNQSLTDVAVVGEKVFKETNNTFTYWVAIQASKQSVLEGMNKSIGQNQKIAQDYDKKKFEEIFNSEMEKLAKERSGN